MPYVNRHKTNEYGGKIPRYVRWGTARRPMVRVRLESIQTADSYPVLEAFRFMLVNIYALWVNDGHG